jgi:hypothetical protein
LAEPLAGLRKEKVKEEKILPKKALLRQGLHLPDQHSTSPKEITGLVWQMFQDPCLSRGTLGTFSSFFLCFFLIVCPA